MSAGRDSESRLLPKDVIKKLSELNPRYVVFVIPLDWALMIAAICVTHLRDLHTARTVITVEGHNQGGPRAFPFGYSHRQH
jgi:hypothetical protein